MTPQLVVALDAKTSRKTFDIQLKNYQKALIRLKAYYCCIDIIITDISALHLQLT